MDFLHNSISIMFSVRSSPDVNMFQTGVSRVRRVYYFHHPLWCSISVFTFPPLVECFDPRLVKCGQALMVNHCIMELRAVLIMCMFATI